MNNVIAQADSLQEAFSLLGIQALIKPDEINYVEGFTFPSSEINDLGVLQLSKPPNPQQRPESKGFR